MEWCDTVVRTLGLEARVLLGPHYGLSITSCHIPALLVSYQMGPVPPKFARDTVFEKRGQASIRDHREYLGLSEISDVVS